MTNHEGTDRDLAREPVVPAADESADYVHPVNHGEGTDEEPFLSEDKGSYVSEGEHQHVPSADTAPMTMDEKGDYVTPVDHGAGVEIDVDEEAGEYVDADHGDENQRDTK